MYADYSFYMNNYYGSAISEIEFNRLSARASAFLDYYTRGKAKNNADLPALKMACCAIAEQYKQADDILTSAEQSGSGIKSESVGSYSVTYQAAAEKISSAESVKNMSAAIARQYLADTGLLYRGRCRTCTPPTL